VSADDSRLVTLAAAVADGMTVDWPAVLCGCSTDAERLQIEELAAIAMLASLHASESVPRTPPQTLQDLPCSWGPLVVQAPVGYGASGVVYRAWDARLDRLVALKIIHAPASGDDVLREGRLLARVRHPNVVTVFGAERIDDHVGLWMEFVEGRNLAQELRDSGPLSASEAMSVAVDLASALAAVHSAGLIHRDVKAQNVLRDRAGRVVLTDFGTGHEQGATASGRLAGTPLYLAPEVLAGGPATIASDIYSLGVLLFFLTSGTFPVRAESVSDLRRAHAHRECRALHDLCPHLPRRFAASVERALAADPAHRFPTADDFRHSLERHTTGRTASLALAAALFICLGIAAVTQWRGTRWMNADASGSQVPAASFAGTVTAPSVESRQLFTEAHAMFFEGYPGMVQAERRLSEAVRDAPEFASAHILLAWAVRNQGRPESDVLPHADRAVALAGSIPLEERLFITASAHQMHGRYAEAASDYERLLRLQPDHYWALGNLAMVYSATGERPNFLVELYERRARVSSGDRDSVANSARELTRLGEIARAQPLVSDALKLPRAGDTIEWIDVAEAYEAWLLDRPAEMQAALDRLRGRLVVLTGLERTRATRDLAAAYLDIGQIGTAIALFQELAATHSDPGALLALAASVRGDLPALRSALGAHLDAGDWSHPEIGPLLFDAGLREAGFEVLRRLQHDQSLEPRLLKTFEGESLLLKGATREARLVLREAINENRVPRPAAGYGDLWHGGAPLLRASLTLARLEVMEGRLHAAIRILEEASLDRVRACVFPQGNGYLWLQIRADLARLYARVERSQDAQRVAEQVRRLLAVADADHPLKYFRVADAGPPREQN
jgi:serine/threonine-protein kinase